MAMDRKPSKFWPVEAAFLAAVKSGDLQAVKGFLMPVAEGEAEEEEDDDEKEEEDGESERIRSLIVSQNEAGETALYIAADNNLCEILKLLVRFYDLPAAQIKSRNGVDALHVAAKNGHTSIVLALVCTWPALCQSTDLTNTCALYIAAEKDHLDIVNTILDADESAIRIVRKNGKTSLHRVVRLGHLRIVQALLSRDPGIVSIKDKKGQTALHMAVKGRSPNTPDIVQELLGVDSVILNEKNKRGNTALHIATEKSRSEIVSLLLTYNHIDVNVINNQKQTPMDLAENLRYSDSALYIKKILSKAGALRAYCVGQPDEQVELRRTVSYIRHELQSQLIQNDKTHKSMVGIAKQVRKLHREAVNNTTNSVTVVAVLVASIAFVAIFNMPGQYIEDSSQGDIGQANIAGSVAFDLFCILNALALFISLAVVVVQITLVAWETKAQRQVLAVMNKLMWVACLCTCAAFLSVAYVVADTWLAVTITVLAVPIILGTLVGLMCFGSQRKLWKSGNDSERRIRRSSISRSFSWSVRSTLSDIEAYDSDYDRKIYVV
ncbi:Ankyrin repeat-containing protein [Nymphaea thermarum]|nr:Ankyrin repeat-containing protein [Nymphaea thermarum]